MAEVYTTTPGEVRQIGIHGQASNDTPAIVPDAVGAELADNPMFRVEVGGQVVTIKPGKYTKKEHAEAIEEAFAKAEKKAQRSGHKE